MTIYIYCIKISLTYLVKKTPETRQNFGLKPNITTLLFPYASRSLLSNRFVAVTFRSEEDVLFRRGPSVKYFCSALDQSLSGFG